MSDLLGGINWVSVDDALPPDNSFVIVYFADRGSVMMCRYYKDFSLARCDMSGFAPHGVTHWAEIVPPITSSGKRRQFDTQMRGLRSHDA